MKAPFAGFNNHIKESRPSPTVPRDSALDRLGGEPLEGSGFEHEQPEAQFQPEALTFEKESQGGLE
jgi:hypothetical protein